MIPTEEFEYLYQKLSHEKMKELYKERTVWADIENSFSPEKMPQIMQIVNGNFVDLIMENVEYLRERKAQQLL